MSSVCIDIGSVDIPFRAIAEQVVSDCEEETFLCDLARASEGIGQSDDPTEKRFALEAARRLRDLAQWFKENQP